MRSPFHPAGALSDWGFPTVPLINQPQTRPPTPPAEPYPPRVTDAYGNILPPDDGKIQPISPKPPATTTTTPPRTTTPTTSPPQGSTPTDATDTGSTPSSTGKYIAAGVIVLAVGGGAYLLMSGKKKRH